MVTRQKLELQINKPVTVELLYDEPIVGENQYGEYFLYAVRVGESEFSFFPPREVHEKLSELRRGDKAVITKLAVQRGRRVVSAYEVAPLNKAKAQQPKAEAEPQPDPEQKIEPSNDGLYQIMLQSYKDAIAIANELNSLGDPTRIAITLFIARSKNNQY